MKLNIEFLDARDSHIYVYRSLRAQSLRESPTAFGSSFEQEACLREPDFIARIRPRDKVSGILGAFSSSNRLVGILGFYREDRSKCQHIGSLRSMYVVPEFRRQGIGAMLLDRALEHARQLEGLRQIILTVTANNVAAVSLYKSRGFTRFGLEPDALFVEGVYYDAEHLILRLDRED
jgi:ribosomal protein S18 acetylase RimI-like enzyme